MNKLFIIVAFLIIILLYVLYNNYKNNKFDKNFKLKYNDSKTVLTLYQLLYDTDKILTKHGIDYWIYAGTLLGAVRHKGLIPWDDDADITVDQQNESKIDKTAMDFDKLGYKLLKVWFGYKIFPKNGNIIQNYEWKYPFLDIFIMKKNVDEYSFCNIRSYLSFKNKFKVDEVYPLKKYKFGNITLKGPGSPLSCLKRWYGDDWNTVGYQPYDHMTESNNRIVKIILTKNDRKCAVPTGPIRK